MTVFRATARRPTLLFSPNRVTTWTRVPARCEVCRGIWKWTVAGVVCQLCGRDLWVLETLVGLDGRDAGWA